MAEAHVRESTIKVSTLELFFDLVFVFTVTQLTAVLAHELTWANAARVLLLLGVIYWMYGGYAWLTNTMAQGNDVRRGLLLAGMAGFLLIALAIPDAFGANGWAFGVGYFVINAIHSGLLLQMAPAAMRTLAPLNLLSASLVLVGGFLPGQWRMAAWALAMCVQIISPYLHPMHEWSIATGHFVERHGLIVIVALGESVVAIGVGAAGLPLTAQLIAVAMLGLATAFALWWIYFGNNDDEAAEHGLEAFPARERGRAALHAFGFAHYPILFGVVVFAAGVKKALAHADHIYLSQALLLGGGVAIFLLGDVWFRRVLRLGDLRYRALGAAAALATVPLGMQWTVAQLTALVAVLGAVIFLERSGSQHGDQRHQRDDRPDAFQQ